MPTPIFKLTAADLETKINPTGAPGYFKVGSGAGQIPTAIIDAELKSQEARVSSSVPEKWRRMYDRIEGLVAVRYATAGATQITLPLTPTGDIQVFVNYPGNFGDGMKPFPSLDGSLKPYAARTAANALTGWTVAGAVITLPAPLAEGDHVIVDFNHDSMEQCYELRMCILELAAAEMLRGFPTMSENVTDKISGWEMNAQLFLKRMWNSENGYRTGIQFFDKLKLVQELETRIAGGVRRAAPGYGALL